MQVIGEKFHNASKPISRKNKEKIISLTPDELAHTMVKANYYGAYHEAYAVFWNLALNELSL